MTATPDVDVDETTALAAAAADRLLPTGATWDRPRLLDTDVHVVRTPTSPGDVPFVLLHHYFGNAHTWRGLVPGLAETAPVVAMDRPGFGFSHREPASRDGWPDRYTRAHSADLLVALLDRLDVERAVLVGCSAGGTATLEVLDRYPERVAGFALVSPAVTGDVGPPEWLRGLARSGLGADLAAKVIASRGVVTRERVGSSWADPSRVTDDDVAAYQLSLDGPHWATALWAAMTADDAPDLRHVFGQVTVPSLFVNGLQDPVIAPKWTKAGAEATPGSRWLPLDGVGHTPQEERPELLLDPLRRLHDDATR